MYVSSFIQIHSDEYAPYQGIYYANVVFTVFFVIEALIKIIAFTPPVSVYYNTIASFYIMCGITCI